MLLSFAIYSLAYQDKNYLHQYIGTFSFGGRSKDQTAKILKDNSEKFLGQKIVLKNTDTGKFYEIDPLEIGLNYDSTKTTDNLWSYGRDSGALGNLIEQMKSLFVKRHYLASVNFNSKGLSQKIISIASELDKPEKDYGIVYQEGAFVMTTERASGMRIDQKKITKDIENRMSLFLSQQLDFSLQNFEPKVTLESATLTLSQANAILSGGELTLKNQDQTFQVDKDTIAGFIAADTTGKQLELKFNEERITKYLEAIAKTIDIDPINAKLKMDGGKVAVFEQAGIGKKLKITETINDIESALLTRINGVSSLVILTVEINKPQISETQISSLGINELVGTATTSFSGSPVNRVHNITVGANGINGVLLAPGETFSTLGHLGSITSEGGYLPELVIKDDSTVPEFGGGLCQVSSTLFRMAVNAGMKITERTNHKYRVGYFEPPIGMDATIYDPAPDFKFVNNYSHHVLIQSKIEGKNLTFEVYGTKDGRKIEISTPVGYDYVSPGEPIMVETDTLPAGEKKQLEKAHQGASAKFDYKVTSTTGEVLQQKTFLSKYIPWPEKWLVGIGTPPATPVPSCTDTVQNGDETGVDCGGSCPTACPV